MAKGEISILQISERQFDIKMLDLCMWHDVIFDWQNFHTSLDIGYTESIHTKYLRYSILMSIYRTKWNRLLMPYCPNICILKCITTLGPASVSKDLLPNYVDVIPMLSWRRNTYNTMTSSWKHFRVTGPFSEEFNGHRWIPLAKASDAELWCFLWSAPWINGWVNNREACDFRRHRAHYEVIVM